MAIFDLLKSELTGIGISKLQKSIWDKTFDIPDLGDEAVGITKGGNEVRDRLVIEATAIGFERDLYIDAYSIDISSSKNIVEKSFIGRDGTLKEYISNGDITASITVTLISDNINKFPEDDFRILWGVLTYNGTIRLQSKLFDRLNAYDFTVFSNGLSAEPYEQQTVTFEVKQDRSIEVDILTLNEF